MYNFVLRGDDNNILAICKILAVVKWTVRSRDCETCASPVSKDYPGYARFDVRPPWNQTKTGFFAEAFVDLVQMLSFKQSSDEGLLFWAAKFFHTLRPDGSVKLGNALTGGLFEGQSLLNN